MYYGRYSYGTIAAAEKIATRMERMKKEDDLAVFGPRILKLMRGVPIEVFRFLDEKPGHFGYMEGRFYMFRRVRNDPAYGRQMFDALAK